MDNNTLKTTLASNLKVKPERLSIAPLEGGGHNLFLEGHAFPMATVKVTNTHIVVARTKSHPVMDEEGLFHHSEGRAAWSADLSAFEERQAQLKAMKEKASNEEEHDIVDFHLDKVAKKIATVHAEHEGRTTGGGGGVLHIPLG